MTIGPSIDRSSAATYAASLRKSRSGLAAPIARKPRPRSARIELSQPLLSAHAPWTKTTVGLVVSMLAPWLRRADRSDPPTHRSRDATHKTWHVSRRKRLGRAPSSWADPLVSALFVGALASDCRDAAPGPARGRPVAHLLRSLCSLPAGPDVALRAGSSLCPRPASS